MGIPYICPYNVNSIMNPILVMCMGLGYCFNIYRGKPLVREGGVVIMTHPTPWEFNPVHHPSYIDFFEQVLSETTDPHVMSQKYEKQFAEDEWYRHLYRTGYAYHGVHPFYMWYWGAHGMQHCGRVIIVGGDVRAVRRLGFTPASTMDDAFEMAIDVVGRTPTIIASARSALDGLRREMSGLMGKRDDAIRNASGLRRAAQVAGGVESVVAKLAKPMANAGFPYRKPTVPRGVVVPKTPPSSERTSRPSGLAPERPATGAPC